MAIIKEIKIRKILNSRGDSTVEVDIVTGKGVGCAAAPSGASTGVHEVQSYPKEGIDYAIDSFKRKYTHRLVGTDVSDQRSFDELLHELDSTDNFSNMGGNISTVVSMAAAKASAMENNLPLYRYLGGEIDFTLPYPFGNVLNGGRHAVGSTDIQEYLVVSLGKNIAGNVFANSLAHKKVKEKLMRLFPDSAIGKGDECGWVARIGNIPALEVVAEACREASGEASFDINPSLDFAASEFFDDGKYVYKEQKLDTDGQIEFVSELVEKYNIYMVEDPLNEEEFDGYAKLTKRIGNRCLVVGDDIFTTNKNRLERGINKKAANAILVKVNQIGTITDTLETVRLAHKNGYKTIISHRSGETCDDTIAHLAVAFGCHGIKTGVVGGERIAKLNELIRIEEDIMANR